MLNEIIHIDQIKTLAEEAVNSWLSYTMSQPVYFDLAILVCFFLQYLGLRKLVTITETIEDSLFRGSIDNFT
jgi:hypothetical protein